MTAVGYGRKLMVVEGLAVCDWTVGQASARATGKQSHPPPWREELPVDWPGKRERGLSVSPGRQQDP